MQNHLDIKQSVLGILMIVKHYLTFILPCVSSTIPSPPFKSKEDEEDWMKWKIFPDKEILPFNLWAELMMKILGIFGMDENMKKDGYRDTLGSKKLEEISTWYVGPNCWNSCLDH